MPLSRPFPSLSPPDLAPRVPLISSTWTVGLHPVPHREVRDIPDEQNLAVLFKMFPPNTPKSCSPSSLLALWLFVQLCFNLNGISAISTSVGPWALTVGLHSLSCCHESVWRKLQNAVRWQLPLTVREPRQYHTVTYWNSQEQLWRRWRSRDTASPSVRSGQFIHSLKSYSRQTKNI